MNYLKRVSRMVVFLGPFLESFIAIQRVSRIGKETMKGRNTLTSNLVECVV